MSLSENDLRNLSDLAGRKDTAIELQTGNQIRYWRNMEGRGYVSLADSAICGFERVRGTYLSITDAGREVVDLRKTTVLQEQE